MLISIVWSKTEGTFQFILDKVTAIQEGPLQLYPGTETKWIKKKKQLSKHRMEFWVWATNASFYSCSIKPLLFHLKVTYSWFHLYFSQWTAVKQTHMIKWLIVLKIKDPENKIVNAPLALCLQDKDWVFFHLIISSNAKMFITNSLCQQRFLFLL